MDAGIEKECSALGGLFQLIMNDMKTSYPTWEDFVSKGAKLQSQLRTTLVVTGAFLDAFQKVADMATGTRGATKEIGSALTRMCMRHRSIESKLKLFTTALSEGLINPLELKMEEWKKVASQLDKDHAKEYKKARADIKKKSSDTIKLQKKVKKGKDEARGQLDSALQDVNTRYAVLEETEKRAVRRALVEERARYCSFVSMLKPVLDHEINMLGEVTHLQTILEDLTNLTAEPNKLPAASEQVILDLKGSDFSYTYQTPPPSPSSSMSRKSSISSLCVKSGRAKPQVLVCSSYSSGSVRHVPSLDSISCAVDGVHLQDPLGSNSQLASGGSGRAENGLLAPPLNAYAHPGERARAMSASGKSCSARDQLGLALGALNSDAPRSSRDSLHCSSGYSTQTTTPSCSEDTIHTHTDYESISLHGDVDSISLHQLSLASSQSDFDKSSTIPRNSDLKIQFREFAQSKRPTSTVSLLAESELSGGSGRQLPYHTATIRRKPSTKPTYRRGTISCGVPIPISTPQVPLKALRGSSGSEENVFKAPPAGGVGGLGHSKLCTSTQSLSALPSSSSSSSPYYQFVPGQMPIPVPVPTVPYQPPEGGNVKQQQQRQQLQQQIDHQQQHGQLQQQLQQQQLQQQLCQLQHNQQLQLQEQLNQHQQHGQLQQLQQQINHQQQHGQLQHNQQLQQQLQQQSQQQINQQQQHGQLQQLQQQINHQQQINQQQQHGQLQQQHGQLQHNQQLQLQQQQIQQQVNHQQQQHYQQLQQQFELQQRLQDPYRPPEDTQQRRQRLFQQQHQDPPQVSAGPDRPPGLGCSTDVDQDPEPPGGGRDMLTLIRRVTLKRTVTDDRSAPLLPPPANHK
ncbi:protein MTSS 1 isoform X2 [Kryptolebias marmoratus]|uniref:protein MTSS 1 isoform X2 n=1 Tax=Kryptolebias marmoratus TaxID=37003 RepID=UPI0018AC8FCA|nr:protein MTSS 1 isoform X2 [Kryptolebias marmoratus]